MRFCGIHWRVSEWLSLTAFFGDRGHQGPYSPYSLKSNSTTVQAIILYIGLNIIFSKLLPHLSGLNELNHWSLDEMADNFKSIFLNDNNHILLTFHWSLFPRVHLMIHQHWFRWWVEIICMKLFTFYIFTSTAIISNMLFSFGCISSTYR